MKRLILAVGAAAVLVLTLIVWRERQEQHAAVASSALPESPTAAPQSPIQGTGRDASPTSRALPSDRAPASEPPSPAEAASTEILVRGSVRDEKGIPVPSVRLTWTNERASQVVAEVKDGAYAVAGLHAGRYVVELSNAGWRSEQFDVALTGAAPIEERNFTAHANPTILIRLVSADGAQLFGFDADQKPLPGNLLIACASRRAPPSVLGPDAQQGASDCARFESRWTLQNLHEDVGPDCLGRVELFERPPLYLTILSGSAVVAQREIQEAPAELVFTVGTDDLRSKLAGLRVRLLQPDGRTPVDQGDVVFIHAPSRGKSDADGLVEVRDLLPGRHTITLGASGCGGRMQEVTLEPGVVLDLGDVPLTHAPKVSLRFEFAGDSRPSVRFTFRREQAGDPLGTLSLYDNLAFASGDKNPYELSSFDPGAYELRVIGFGSPMDRTKLHMGARPVRVVIRDQPTNEVEVKIVAQTEVLLRTGSDSAGLSRWLVSTQDGLPCRRVWINGRAPTSIELVPGEYTIARIDSENSSLGKAQAFRVGSESSTVELQP